MNIVILTQDDPFFLAENLDYLLSRLPEGVQVSGCVVFDVSPSGKKEGLVKQAVKTWKTFGTGFFLNYGFRFVANKLNKQKKVKHILRKHSVPVIELQESVNAPSSLQKIKAREPDLLISIAGNQIFKKERSNLFCQIFVKCKNMCYIVYKELYIEAFLKYQCYMMLNKYLDDGKEK